MQPIGFSTGALAYADFAEGLRMSRDEGVRAVELSALRIAEWPRLLSSLPEMDLSMFDYVSVHLPSSMSANDERCVIASLKGWADQHKWPLILHPDVISDWESWRALGAVVCVENMDMRKPTGRTEAELEKIFNRLPEARFCFDIGHAWQVDPTMGEAYWILKRFANQLVQVHVSEVNSHSKHDTLSYSTIESFQQVAKMIPADVPLILETPVTQSGMRQEMNKALFALARHHNSALVA